MSNIEKLDPDIYFFDDDGNAVGRRDVSNNKELMDKVNELVDEINKLKMQIAEGRRYR